MKDNKLPYSIIGCGTIARAHLEGLRLLQMAGLQDFDLVAVCDVNAENAHALANQAAAFLGKKPAVFTDWEKLFQTQQLVAVNDCTPTFQHHIITRAALESGCHVLTEKPLALTVRAAQQLLAVAAQKKKILATAENYRRRLYNRILGWAIEQGMIGELRTVIVRDHDFRDVIILDTDWRHLKKYCGTHLLDRGVHHSDLLEYLAGTVDRVCGVVQVAEPLRRTYDGDGRAVRTLRCDAEDTCHGLVHFNNGAIGMYYFTAAGHGRRYAHGAWWGAGEGHWTFFGNQGSICAGEVEFDDGKKIPPDELERLFFQKLDLERKETWFPRGITDAFAIEQHDFFRAILEQRGPEVSGVGGLRNLAVAYAFCESSLRGATVKVNEIESGHISDFQNELDRQMGFA